MVNIYDVVLWILFIAAVITVLWYLFGSSPTFEQSLIIAMSTFLFAIYGKLKSLESSFKHMERSFAHLAGDFKEHLREHVRGKA